MAVRKTQFGRDVAIASVATLIKSLRNLILVRLLTFNLSMADFGVWEQISVGIALVLPWVTMQLPGALVRFLAGKQDRDELQEGFYSVLFSVLGASSLFALGLWAALPALAFFPPLLPFQLHAEVILPLIPLSAAVNVVVAYLRAFRLMVRHSLLGLAQNFGEVLAVGHAVLAGYGLYGALLAMGAIRGIILAAGLAIAVVRIGFKWPRWHLFREYLLYSLPLIPTSSCYRLFDAGDRFVIKYFNGDAAVGLYTAAYTAGSFFTTLVSPLHLVLLPVLAELWHGRRLDELEEYATLTLRYSALFTLPATVGALLLARPLLLLLVPNSYGEAVHLFPLLGVGFAVFGLGVLGSNLLATFGQTRLILSLVASLAVANIASNLLLVPLLGILGAALATVLSQFAFAFGALACARRTVHFALPWKALLHYLGCTAGMGLVIHATIYFRFDLHLFTHIALGASVYFLLLWLSGGITHREFDFLHRVILRR